MLGVSEELDSEEREPMGLEEPAHVAGRDVELDEAVCDVRVVVQEAEAAHAAVASRAEEPAVLRRERAEQELAEIARRVEPVVALEPVAGLGERREREAVPGGERLVVAERLRAACPGARATGARSSRSSSPRTMNRPCSNGSSSSRGRPTASASSGVHVCVSPSTPSVSASCAEASPPSGERELPEHVVDRLLDDLAGNARLPVTTHAWRYVDASTALS